MTGSMLSSPGVGKRVSGVSLGGRVVVVGGVNGGGVGITSVGICVAGASVGTPGTTGGIVGSTGGIVGTTGGRVGSTGGGVGITGGSVMSTGAGVDGCKVGGGVGRITRIVGALVLFVPASAAAIRKAREKTERFIVQYLLRLLSWCTRSRESV